MPYFDLNGDGKIDRDRRSIAEVRFRRRFSTASLRIRPTAASGARFPGRCPGRIVRIDPEDLRLGGLRAAVQQSGGELNGYTPRGIDVDSYGVIWTALAGSGHLASFDRRKCKVLSGPEATTGQHCPEGWTLYPDAGPALQGRADAISPSTCSTTTSSIASTRWDSG